MYALDPLIYDALSFLGWEDRELTDLVDFSGKTVIDVGTGTGQLSFLTARQGALVFAVEPVGNLRSQAMGLNVKIGVPADSKLQF